MYAFTRNKHQLLSHGSKQISSLPIERIAFFEFLKNSNFNLTGIAVLWYSPDNLDRDPGVCLGV